MRTIIIMIILTRTIIFAKMTRMMNMIKMIMTTNDGNHTTYVIYHFEIIFVLNSSDNDGKQ